MILIKDMHGKSQWAYADKSIEPWPRVIPSPELIQFWRETRWRKQKTLKSTSENEPG